MARGSGERGLTMVDWPSLMISWNLTDGTLEGVTGREIRISACPWLDEAGDVRDLTKGLMWSMGRAGRGAPESGARYCVCDGMCVRDEQAVDSSSR